MQEAFLNKYILYWEQVWHSDERVHLLPMWSVFDSGHRWVVVGSCHAGFPPSTKTNISNSKKNVLYFIHSILRLCNSFVASCNGLIYMDPTDGNVDTSALQEI